MATTYRRMKRNPEFTRERMGPVADELWLTRFARAYQDNKPVAPGLQITIGMSYFLLTNVEALALARDLIRAYTGEGLEDDATCDECGEIRIGDDRVANGLKCGRCSYA